VNAPADDYTKYRILLDGLRTYKPNFVSNAEWTLYFAKGTGFDNSIYARFEKADGEGTIWFTNAYPSLALLRMEWAAPDTTETLLWAAATPLSIVTTL
jgi:hypothetical protein